MTTELPIDWKSFTLRDLLVVSDLPPQDSTKTSHDTVCLFAALTDLGWDGECLQSRNNAHFLRWKGETLNALGETMGDSGGDPHYSTPGWRGVFGGKDIQRSRALPGWGPLAMPFNQQKIGALRSALLSKIEGHQIEAATSLVQAQGAAKRRI